MSRAALPTPDMQSKPVFEIENLQVLFDEEAYTGDASLALPSSKQLTEWIRLALQSTPWRDTRPAAGSQPVEPGVEISVSYVSSDEIRTLNAQYRDRDSVTNVLSFPADMPILPEGNEGTASMELLGDVVLCPEVVAVEAVEQQKPLEHHWAHLVVHSVLHLIGMDHQSNSAADTMETVEIQILSELGIPDPYLALSANQS